MTSIPLRLDDLAAEFDASPETMGRFVQRFCPATVLPDTFSQISDTLLFVHIPKTAGVSVGKTFQATFDRFYSVQWDNIGPSFRHATRAATYEQSRRTGRQVIMGHFGWPELQLWRNHDLPMKCGAIFRDPVARTVSNYNYNCSSRHPGHETFAAKFPTLESYARNTALDFQVNQAIGFCASFDNILDKLVRHYTFLGITEALADSLQHLSLSHGLRPFSVHRENVGKPAGDSIEPQVLKLIQDRTHNDRKLHRLLCRIYGADAA